MKKKENSHISLYHKNQDRLAISLIVFVTILIFWSVSGHDFVYLDDNLYVFENSHVQNGITLDSIAWAFKAIHAGNWHPVTWLSHMLDVSLFGPDPGMHHMTNVFFHLLNVILLYLILKSGTGDGRKSAIVAGLFALHPFHVESVAWISERKDVLSTFFGMLTIWVYLKWVKVPSVSRYIQLVLCFSLGLMSKPMLVTFPLVLLLLDYWPLERLQVHGADLDFGQNIKILKRMVWEKIPLFCLAGGSCLVTLVAQKQGGAVATLASLPFLSRVVNAAVSYFLYIYKTILPFNLAVFYPHPGVWPWWLIAVSFMALIIISFFAIKTFNRAPYFAVGWLWYMGTLVPVIGLVQVGVQSMADRYTYIPLIGIFIAAVWGISGLFSRLLQKKHLVPALVSCVFIIFAILTWKQVAFWKNSIVLFEHTLEVTEGNWLSHNNLGIALKREGRVPEAMEHFKEAVRINPDYAEAHNNLGIALIGTGKLEEAISHYKEAIQIDPNYTEAHYNLAIAFEKAGRTDLAIKEYRQAIELNRNFAKASNNLGLLYLKQGSIEEAITQYNEALRVEPGYAMAHNNLGIAYAQIKRTDEAVKHFQEAIRIKPDFLSAHAHLGRIYYDKGDLAKAEHHFRTAIQINPNFSYARKQLEAILRNKRQ